MVSGSCTSVSHLLFNLTENESNGHEKSKKKSIYNKHTWNTHRPNK